MASFFKREAKVLLVWHLLFVLLGLTLAVVIPRLFR
jgi:hypothetical protein